MLWLVGQRKRQWRGHFDGRTSMHMYGLSAYMRIELAILEELG